MLVDSHAHLNISAFDVDRDAVMNRIKAADMKVINIGTNPATSQQVINLARQHDCCYAAVGIHPIYFGGYELDPQEQADIPTENSAEMIASIERLANRGKVVAVGETGLDYFRLTGDVAGAKAEQKKYFIQQLEIAAKYNLPVILHARSSPSNQTDAYDDILEIISSRKLTGMIHCFGSTLAIAQKFVALGFYVGFTGIITFKKRAEELQNIAAILPLDKILIETDAPYLAPEPYRGQRNEPAYVVEVAKKIAELRGVSVNEVIAATTANAHQLFTIS